MPHPQKNRLEALLLVGPTGAGKTPLGQLLETEGLRGRDCLHFDFGENLRQVVAQRTADAVVSPTDIEYLRQVLATGALLEDRDFPIARRILQSFCVRRQPEAGTVIVLNGLPRHAGQAEALAEWVSLRTVVVLNCTATTVAARIAANTGGDRTDRSDDRQSDVARKLEIYAERTVPLVDQLRRQGATVVTIEVTAGMTAAKMRDRLVQQLRWAADARRRADS
jgi:adenylate kinase family enzyme